MNFRDLEDDDDVFKTEKDVLDLAGITEIWQVSITAGDSDYGYLTVE